MQFWTVVCDVPECKESYSFKSGESIPPNHPSNKWLNVGGYSICSIHNEVIKTEMVILGLKVLKG